MDQILDPPPERDYLGPPVRPVMDLDDSDDDLDEAEMQKFISGDFPAFGLPMPLSMLTAAEAQREAREGSTQALNEEDENTKDQYHYHNMAEHIDQTAKL